MSKSSFIVMGLILAILGGVTLGWQKITYTTRDTVVDVGSLKITADNKKSIPLSPVLGGIALAGGVGK